jgi:aminoglycoside 2''-phosphotransferase
MLWLPIEHMNVETYKRIIEACFPQVRVDRIVSASEGWDSVTVEVNGEYIFRFPKRPDVELQYEKEVSLLAELAPHLSVAVPRFEFVWNGGAPADMRFVGYRKIMGVPLASDRFTAGQLARLAGPISTFLSELHRFPVAHAERLLVPGGGVNQWRQRYQKFYEEVQARVFSLMDAPMRAKTAILWEGFLSEEALFRFIPTLIHHDLNPEHILCDPTGARLAGIIDWGDVAIGDPAIDFAGIFYNCGAELTEQALAGYQGMVDETFRRRVAFYARIVPLHEVLFGIAIGHDAHIRQGLEDLRLRLAG